MIRILVPGVPVGKGRPRMTRSGHCYTPEKTRIYEDKIAFFGHQAMAGKRPLEGYLTIQVEAVFPVPESWSKKKKKMALDGKLFPGRPDIDNILKAIDGLNGVVWKDDAQIILAVQRPDGAAADPALYSGVHYLLDQSDRGGVAMIHFLIFLSLSIAGGIIGCFVGVSVDTMMKCWDTKRRRNDHV